MKFESLNYWPSPWLTIPWHQIPWHQKNTAVVLVSPDTAEGATQSNHPPKDLSSVFEEIAQEAQEQFEVGGGDQTPKRPPISIPSDSELVSILDDARDNIMCDMHKNRDYYYVTCRVPQPRKEAQVKPRAMMLRRRRIAKAKAIVGQLLGEAHGFTDAEVEEFTLQYMNLSDQLMFKPGDNQQAKIATQTLLHMDCNAMSDQQVTNLMWASQHPWLKGAKLVKQRKELTQEVIPKHDLEGKTLPPADDGDVDVLHGDHAAAIVDFVLRDDSTDGWR
eukprot:g76537.t1